LFVNWGLLNTLFNDARALKGIAKVNPLIGYSFLFVQVCFNSKDTAHISIITHQSTFPVIPSHKAKGKPISQKKLTVSVFVLIIALSTSFFIY